MSRVGRVDVQRGEVEVRALHFPLSERSRMASDCTTQWNTFHSFFNSKALTLRYTTYTQPRAPLHASNAGSPRLLAMQTAQLLERMLNVPSATSASTSHAELENSNALELNSSPMISPNNPSTDEKISITRIFTNLPSTNQHAPSHTPLQYTHRLGSAASANAALLPFIPTLTPQIRLHIPTSTPDQNSA